MKKIRTTGELRAFLVETMEGLESGSVSLDSARGIVKLSAQINESFYSEIKVARTLLDAGKSVSDLGKLSVE